MLEQLARAGLLKGKTIGVDATTLEADAAMRSIVRRATGESYREYLAKLAAADGEASDAAALQRRDRKRKKKVSNKDWVNPHDREAEITKMKDGRTRLAYKAEQAVDLDTGAIVATTAHPGASGDTTSIQETVPAAGEAVAEQMAMAQDVNEAGVEEVVADKGYHSGATLEKLVEWGLRSYVSEPERDAAVTSAWAGRSEKETTAPSGGVQSGAAAADQAWCGNAARLGRGRENPLRGDFGTVGDARRACSAQQRPDQQIRPFRPAAAYPIPSPALLPPVPRKRRFRHGLLGQLDLEGSDLL